MDVEKNDMISGTTSRKNQQDSTQQESLDSPTRKMEDSNFITNSTSDDMADMARMGRPQQFKRRFRLVSSFCFIIVALSNWEVGLFVLNQGLIDGGRSGLIWTTIWNFVGFIPVYLSMAEMASISPALGAQFHWVSEFASSNRQRTLSYFTGWLSTLAFQSLMAFYFIVTGSLVQVIIAINNTSYTSPRWQCTLFAIAVICASLIINIFCMRFLPMIQNVITVLQFALCVILVVSVFVLSPTASAREVFLDFTDSGGWSSLGLSVLVGQLSGIGPNIGFDAVAHISEEVKDASRNIPISMMGSFIVNALTAILTQITIMFGLTDVKAALGPTGSNLVSVWVLQNTMSPPCLTAFLVGILLLLLFGAASYMTACARDLFAFSRDYGFVFSNHLGQMNEKFHLPINAIIFTGFISIALCLIYIGSLTAFYAFVSLATSGFLLCYTMSIGSFLWRRVRQKKSLPVARWSLGRYGLLCNVLAVIWCVWCVFWTFWPQFYVIVPETFNWAVVIFAAVMLLSTVYFFAQARHVYEGPVSLMKKDS